MANPKPLATYKIYQVWRKQIEAFADARCGEDQSLYKKRGSFKREDIIAGALGEVGAYLWLRENGLKVNKPDFTIYEAKQKTFNADLTDGSKYFHVKCQSSASAARYGYSWLMQRHDPIITKPQARHYFIFCSANLNTGEVKILAAPTIINVIDKGCIGECKVPSFRATKVAIYLDTVLENLSNTSLKRAIMGSQKGKEEK